jgi:hypothetical protein
VNCLRPRIHLDQSTLVGNGGHGRESSCGSLTRGADASKPEQVPRFREIKVNGPNQRQLTRKSSFSAASEWWEWRPSGGRRPSPGFWSSRGVSWGPCISCTAAVEMPCINCDAPMSQVSRAVIIEFGGRRRYIKEDTSDGRDDELVEPAVYVEHGQGT